MHSYKAFFKNPNDPNDTSFEPHPTDYPFVELEYPNDAACERFMLLEPKDKDHYNPIMCLEDTLHTIVEYYLTPAQQSLLGSLPDHSLSSPKNRPPNSSHSATSSISSLSALSDLSDLSDLTSLSSESSLSSLSSLSALSEESSPPQNLLRSLSRAIHLRDGPQFLSTMRHINNILRMIKYPYVPELSPCSPTINPLREIPKLWSTTGIPQKVMTRIIEETYQRSIGPNIAKLRQYSAFSSEVYGELMPAFTSDIVNATGLRPDALFVDLGCGVGNVVLQASLQTGCRSFGIEIMPGPSSLAKGQLEQFKKRCRMWGVEAGEVELMQGDMTDCRRVDELLSQADVVLVNNFVFREELNAALRPKFLDLKEGAIVVSLKPFAPPTNQRLTERNIDDISAIFDVVRRPYHSGTVSWSSGSGHYYIHRVDRASYSDCRQQFERVHSRLGRRRSAKR
ncbi:DOT1-domain-containing protein [Rickenella mellea]|uniref:Histone-lysine N-methyltransferase, H3 lysine-79 specific n=1 Tax=Rickenella mellea TaxID=50990 RepID=A0A4Y7QPX7_9AGAM|nr:DOT1-domain-containing protein [Rickenella mellea]